MKEAAEKEWEEFKAERTAGVEEIGHLRERVAEEEERKKTERRELTADEDIHMGEDDKKDVKPIPSTNGTSDEKPTEVPKMEVDDEHPASEVKVEEEVPKKKQGTGADEHERRLQESIYRKMEQNRPKKEFQSGPRNVSAGGRISQPAGKTFAV